MSQKNTIARAAWPLKRYGRVVPRAKDSGGSSAWKVLESSESAGKLELVILESGHLLVSQAQELLEGFSLLNARSFLKVHQKSDSLLFHLTLKGESRMIRLQFDGSNRSEAVDLCRKAVERLQEYLPVGTDEHCVPPPSTHTSESAPCDPQKQTPIDALQDGPDVIQESLTIKQLSKHFLGQHELSLPLAYRHCTVPPGAVEELLRLCLLDSGFPAFVEEVENNLKALTEE
ncbi:meiotic recombination protein REC114 [Brachyhypopomus gauderio]|uniref:meiotic recombination protein REC114 n=1 Tax=Brachyhypopomus gauderio TaxID=698409 RepID=UPI00404267C7